MGYNDRDLPMVESEEQGPDHAVNRAVSMALTALIRTFGFVLIAVGLWAVVTVLFEAVGLYRNPGRIEAMVVSIEQAAGVHRIAIPQAAATPPDEPIGRAPAQPASGNEFRPAYFLGWFMAILLFLVIGKLADWIISRGLALVSFRCRPRIENG